MLLSAEVPRTAQPCYLCELRRRLEDFSEYVTVWPLVMKEASATLERPEKFAYINTGKKVLTLPKGVGSWTWKVYLASETSDYNSRHKNIETCYLHGSVLYLEWILIAQAELDFDRAFYAYVDRMER